VHDQIAGDDPPADRTGCNVESFRDFGDRGKFDVIVPVTATIGNFDSHDALPASKIDATIRPNRVLTILALATLMMI
jgi:hypothetical protein